MSVNVSSLSPTKLAELLRSKKSLTIQHRQSKDSEARVLFDGFPRDVAVAFSRTISGKFPHIRTMTLAEMQRHIEPQLITVEGISCEAFKDIFQWMLDSCKGQGLAPYSESTEAPFVAAHNHRLAAESLKLTTYESKVEGYIQRRLEDHRGLYTNEVVALHAVHIYFEYRPVTKYIPPSEISDLLGQYGYDETTLKMLVDYVTDITWKDLEIKEGQCRNASSNVDGRVLKGRNNRPTFPSHGYVPIRKQYPKFGSAIDEQLQLRKLEKAASSGCGKT